MTYLTAFVVSCETIGAIHPTCGLVVSALISLLAMMLHVMAWRLTYAGLAASVVDLEAGGACHLTTEGDAVGPDHSRKQRYFWSVCAFT